MDHKNTVLMSSMILALTEVKLYFPKFVPIVASKAVHPTDSGIGCQKTSRIMLLRLVLLANNDCAINRAGSSSNSNGVNDYKTRQDKIYFESARHIKINIRSRALLNRLFENKCIKSTYVQQLQKKNSL